LAIGVVDKLRGESTPLVLQIDEARVGISSEVWLDFRFVLGEKVVPQDEEIAAVHHLESVSKRVPFDCKNYGDCTHHE
jgi:hypothetical protein